MNNIKVIQFSRTLKVTITYEIFLAVEINTLDHSFTQMFNTV